MQLGHFTLKQEIGTGGMAVVWLAVERTSGMQVAIKLLRSELANDAVLRGQFLTEAKTIAGLHHPNIIKLFDYGVVSDELVGLKDVGIGAGTPYYVMEYFAEGTLREKLPQLSWETLKHHLLSILDALATAHAHGLVHRDLKPSNILMGPRGPIISDFGIAYNVNTTEDTGALGFSGTPNYMAPEQFREQRRAFGPWTDIYAIGCLTYWLCTFMPPFRSASMAELIVNHLRYEPLPLEPRFEVPRSFFSWVARCLEKEIGERHQLAADAAYALLELGGAMHPATPGLGQREPSPTDDERTLILQPTLLSRSDDTLTATTVSGRTVRVASSWRRPCDLENTWEPSLSRLNLISIADPPFVGRAQERDLIWAELVAAIQQGVRVVGLQGESGVGKTSLMNWIAVRAHVLGVALPLTIEHTAKVEQGFGIGGMLRRELKAMGLAGEALKSLLSDYCQRQGAEEDVDALYACMEPHGSVGNVADAMQQASRFEAVSRWLGRVCGARPRILIVDDFQWQDETEAFINHLVRGYGSLPILIIVAHRNEEGGQGSSLGASLGDRLRDAPLTTLSLTRMSRDVHADLVRAQVAISTAAVELLYEWSGGHPLTLQRTLRGLHKSGRLELADDGYYVIDASEINKHGESFSDWLAPLEPWLERLPKLLVSLQAAVCLGRSFRISEWVSVCAQLGVTESEAGIDVLVDERFLHLDKFGRASFVYSQCQEVLAKHLKGTPRWRHYHRCIADTLAAQRRVHPWRLAEHYQHAACYEFALEPLSEAWRTAMSQECYPNVRAILMAWATCLRRLSYGLGSVEWLSLKLKWAEYCHQAGHPGSSARHAAGLYARAEKKPLSALHIEALLKWTFADKWKLGASDANLERMERARQLAMELDDPRLIARCIERHAVYLHTYGQLDEALVQFKSAGKLIDHDHMPKLAALLHRGIARLLLDKGKLNAAVQHGERALRLVDHEPEGSFAASIHLTLGDLARRQGDFDEAETHYKKAVSTFQRYGLPDVWAAAANLGMLGYARRRWRDGNEWIEHAILVAQRVDNRAAELMLKSIGLAGRAHRREWGRFDAVLEALVSLPEHFYAQRDSADTLKSLVNDLRRMGEADRANGVQRLADLQYQALGL